MIVHRSALVSRCLCALALIVIPGAGRADSLAANAGLSGTWIINEKLSDDTDRQIEKAVRANGGRIDSGGKRGKGRYKGGPKEQELYDRLAYDEALNISQSGAEVRILYEEGFERVFHTDGRGREVSASGSGSGDPGDFSFGAWNGATLRVEAKPRDGGWTSEVYTLEPGGSQLRVELHLKPLLFPVPVDIVRIFDRGGGGD